MTWVQFAGILVLPEEVDDEQQRLFPLYLGSAKRAQDLTWIRVPRAINLIDPVATLLNCHALP